MKNIKHLFADFYRDSSLIENLIIYEQEKRYYPMDDFDRFLESIPSEIRIPPVSNSSFLREVPELVTLYWGYKIDNKEENGGEFNLYHPLNALISNTVEANLVNTDLDASSLRWIDSHPHTGDGVMIVADLTKWPDWKSTDLMILDENGKLFEMTIKYESYLILTYITKGFYNWQYLFVKKKSIESERKKYLMNYYFLPMKKALPQLFPAVDYSDIFKTIDQF